MQPTITPSNIHPLTDFKRHTADFVQRMQDSGDPLVLTVNGKARVVVQDAEAYQKLLNAAEETEAEISTNRPANSVSVQRFNAGANF